MNKDFLFGPTPHQEAVDFIQSKPVVSREVFENLLPDLRARAFLISGVESASVVQGIRDRIAELPAGANWDDIKKDIAADLHPFLANPDDPDNTIAADRRAELLLRMHGFQAYQAAQYNVMDRQRDVFPYWRYQTMEDDRVRPEHAALDGIVLPSDHEFWQHHYPPWNFGCRCQVIPVSQSDYDDKQKEDEKQPPDQKDILDDYAQRDLTATRRLVRNGVSYNVTAPAEEGKPGAFRFVPGELRIPVAELRGRYDAATWAQFESFAKNTDLGQGRSVWDWMNGERLAPSDSTFRALQTTHEVDQWLAKNMQPTLDKLPANQKDALRAYQGYGSWQINRALREGASFFAGYVPAEAAEIKDSIHQLDRAVKAGTVPENITVFRRTDWPGEWVVGDTLNEHGFFSTSMSKEAASHFTGDTIAEIRVQAGTHAAWTDDLTRHHGHEKELLFARGTRFNILSVEMREGIRHVVLEIIPSEI